ncbi:HpcH/HpaI aldolase/citrate lyase family protein [bacterium]|nr:HpcH/HpaI aldolase/citrate lyase family protein [bacterium]
MRSGKNRLRRSRLYIPGNNPSFMYNARLYGADCLILDLEDAVAPLEKDAARILVKHAIKRIDWGNSELIVRINPLNSGFGREDIRVIAPMAPNAILIPKCESAHDVNAVEELVTDYARSQGVYEEIYLIPLIETAKGVLNAYEIASASPNICAITFGAEDFTKDMGISRTREGKETFIARSIIAMAAKAARVQALDTVFSDINDIDGLIESAKEAKMLGFDGKGLIHPSQIEPVHKVFTPTKEEIEYASKVVAAYEAAKSEGKGIVALGSKMIDKPVVERAIHTIEYAKQLGLIKEEER